MALESGLVRTRLSRTQYRVLALLQSNGELVVNQVRAQLDLSGPTVWAAIKPLTERRLVKAAKSPRDGRERVLTLTSRGSTAERELSGLVRDQLQEACARVGQGSWRKWREATDVLGEPCRDEFGAP